MRPTDTYELEPAIAFLVHHPAILPHYLNVWQKLDPSLFVVVLVSRSENYWVSGAGRSVTSRLGSLGYRWVIEKDNERDFLRYKVVVANHKISGIWWVRSARANFLYASIVNGVKKWLNNAFKFAGIQRRYRQVKDYRSPVNIYGQTKVRFMYGPDISPGWSLGAWNKMFDFFMCHGRHDANEVAQRFRGQPVEMGYPRYGLKQPNHLELDELRQEFGLNREKKTILYMPSFGFGAPNSADSLTFFSEIEKILGLTRNFNVILRPHPFSLKTLSTQIGALAKVGVKVDTLADRDIAHLVWCCDFFVGDIGESPFSALYFRKRTILLYEKGIEKSKFLRNSSNLLLNEIYPVLRRGAPTHIIEDVFKEDFWSSDRAAAAERLRARFFTDHEGDDETFAANFLATLLGEGDVSPFFRLENYGSSPATSGRGQGDPSRQDQER